MNLFTLPARFKMQNVYWQQQDSIFETIIVYFPDAMPLIPVWFGKCYQCGCLVKHATTTYVDDKQFLCYKSTMYMLVWIVADFFLNEAVHIGY